MKGMTNNSIPSWVLGVARAGRFVWQRFVCMCVCVHLQIRTGEHVAVSIFADNVCVCVKGENHDQDAVRKRRRS